MIPTINWYISLLSLMEHEAYVLQLRTPPQAPANIASLLGDRLPIARRNLLHSLTMIVGRTVAQFVQQPRCILALTPLKVSLSCVFVWTDPCLHLVVDLSGRCHKDSLGVDNWFRRDACFLRVYWYNPCNFPNLDW